MLKIFAERTVVFREQEAEKSRSEFLVRPLVHESIFIIGSLGDSQLSRLVRKISKLGVLNGTDRIADGTCHKSESGILKDVQSIPWNVAVKKFEC